MILDEDVLKLQEEKESKKEKNIKLFYKRKADFKNAMKLSCLSKDMTNPQLKVICPYKKRKQDYAIPHNKEELLIQYNTTVNSTELTMNK